MIDRALYLPCCWADDPQRRVAAGIPADLRFATKSALARLHGVADELRTTTGSRSPPVEQADHDASVAACRRAMGDAYEDALAVAVA